MWEHACEHPQPEQARLVSYPGRQFTATAGAEAPLLLRGRTSTAAGLSRVRDLVAPGLLLRSRFLASPGSACVGMK